ncbi:hypothetical protein GRX03_11930 [Halovenus sp. WSH3]|uniref:DUF8125 domain-containing protein n=1 Tax=Halovenus carboxidivorans TaxID=2692199 RepID=A0A6B0T247_9EURY|nr:hypothetical protein [Halovenus carboxidivorans]MXR52308.1 hypothetical protein [Halovenus carboxidivorans]
MSDTTQRAKEISSNLERRTLDRLAGLRTFADENSRLLLLFGLLVVLLQWAGIINLAIPNWWPYALAITLSATAAAYVGADKVADLIPEEDGILLVSYTVDDGTGGAIWEVSEDTWAEMTVDGTLFEWSQSHRRIYECRDYDPDSNHAVANWRESAPASEFAEERSVDDALAAVRELRQDLEPEAAKAREMRRRIRGITRQLDRQRAQELNTAIDEATVDADMGEATISQILDDALPDDLHPHAGGGETDEKKNGDKADEHWRDEPMVDLSGVDFEEDPLRAHQ